MNYVGDYNDGEKAEEKEEEEQGNWWRYETRQTIDNKMVRIWRQKRVTAADRVYARIQIEFIFQKQTKDST